MNSPRRLAFLVSSLDCPIGRQVTHSINRFYGECKFQADLLAFYHELKPLDVVPMFAVFNSTELYDFSGDAVATDLVSASYLVKCPGPRRRFFYVAEAEWTALRSSWSYRDFVDVYRNPRLQILTPHATMTRRIERSWNREVHREVDLDRMDRLLKELSDA